MSWWGLLILWIGAAVGFLGIYRLGYTNGYEYGHVEGHICQVINHGLQQLEDEANE